MLKELAASARAYRDAKKELGKNPPLDVLWPKFLELRFSKYDALLVETDPDKIE